MGTNKNISFLLMLNIAQTIEPFALEKLPISLHSFFEFFFIFRLLSSFIKENGPCMSRSIGKSKSCLQEKRSCRCKGLGKVSTRLDYESTSLSVLNVHNHDSSDYECHKLVYLAVKTISFGQVYLIFVHFSTVFFFPIYNVHQMTCFAVVWTV